MALPLSHTLSRNITRDKILNGSYPNVRIHGIEGNMNPFQPWATLKAALADRPTPSPGDKHGCDLEPGSGKCDSDSSQLMSFSSTCFYYGISLSEELEMSTGAPPPPIGMVHTSFGGSSIEQWLTNETIATCANASIGPTNQVCVCVCLRTSPAPTAAAACTAFTAAAGAAAACTAAAAAAAAAAA